MASRMYQIYQFLPENNKIQLIQEQESPLRHQVSSVAWFNNQPYLGSVEGRVASLNIAFRAHKKVVGQNVLSFPVNQMINYKDLYLFTCGSDGAVYVWNIDKKRKIYEIKEKYMIRRMLILKDQKNKNEYLYTFQSYDWSQRSEGLQKQEIQIKQYVIKKL